ncbi:MAG: polysaccharide deacetylase family protein [Deltaproteobacteria bacterium]|nr:polysaccharide deacetylase family protein [Deltaproteobacteria bacterium]
MSYAILSCDLDTVDRHLQGYGFDDLPPCDAIYRAAVPRIQALLAELGQPAVFFVIARDAEAQAPLLRQLHAAGHEIASHSLTHPQPFRTLDDAALRAEIGESRRRLRAACGADVVGFRAPAWDVDRRVLRLVAEAGYRYDASVLPTPALLASRVAAYRRSTGKRSLFAMDLLGHAFAPRAPHRADGNGLVEFPVAVTPWLRLPVYHTITHLAPQWVTRRSLRAALRSPAPLCYEFHAADLLDLVADGVDVRLARHPGMRLPVAVKRRALRDVLRTIAAARRVVTYAQALEERRAA